MSDGVDDVIALLKKAQFPPEDAVRRLCTQAIEMLSDGPSIVEVHPPVTICGDTHGQLFDLLELFAVGGQCPDTSYLFLGDYVDRGYFSVETFLLLVALKVRYPARMTLLRGNHESRQTTQAYGFYDEVLRKYGDASVWDMFSRVFNVLPLCGLVGGKVFCVHGGLSPLFTTLEQVNRLDRKKDVPERGMMCDLLWSDPDNVPNFTMSPRGAGYLFGETDVTKFSRQNKLSLICRAHQLANEGYVEWFNKKLFTVWSAPNYCYRGGNPASLLEVSSDCSTRWKMFEAAPADARGEMPDKTQLAYFM